MLVRLNLVLRPAWFIRTIPVKITFNFLFYKKYFYAGVGRSLSAVDILLLKLLVSLLCTGVMLRFVQSVFLGGQSRGIGETQEL